MQARAFAQEFGIGSHREVSIGFLAMVLFVGFANDGVYPVAAADGNGGFVHHYRKIARVVLANAFGGRGYVPQIRAAVGRRRRSHGDENHIRMRNSGGVIAAELKIRSRFGEQFRQVWFIDWCFAGPQQRDLLLIGIDAGNFVSQKSQTGSCRQSYVARANDRYIHEFSYVPSLQLTERR